LRTTDAGVCVLDGDAVRSKKQVVIGTFVSGVAHEVGGAWPAHAPEASQHSPRNSRVWIRGVIFFSVKINISAEYKQVSGYEPR
jgi:hypothetical protein